jgi:multiple sugar transport system substrate-binding protein
MDYMTEGTADTAVRQALDTCSAQTGIKVDRQPVPYPELVQKVLLAASSNSLPDIIYIDNSDVAQLADGGYVAPLSEVGIKTEGFVPALAALGEYKGAEYAVPSANNTIALYYNTEMLKAAGWSRQRPGTSLRETAKKLTKDQTYGLVYPGINNEQGAFHTSTFVWSNGGSFEKLNSPEVVGAISYLKSLIDDGSVSKSVVNVGDRRCARSVRFRPRRDDDRWIVAAAAARRASGTESTASCRSRRRRPESRSKCRSAVSCGLCR